MTNLAGLPPLGQKIKQERGTVAARGHMARVAACPCVVCHKPGPSTVHHCICGRYSQARASDFATIPLCWECHLGPQGIHANKSAWVEANGPDTDFLPVVADMIAGDWVRP